MEYAADLAASTYGSGFPNTARSGCSDSTFDYRTSLFNLNNIYKSPESMLAISDLRNEQISGVSTPWVYLGMKFSSFCWHVEDLYISSINYNHRGSSKIWYIIPSSNKQKFDQFARTKMPKTLVGKPDALHRITFMVDPLEIIAAGINVYKIDHTPRSYVFTFPKVHRRPLRFITQGSPPGSTWARQSTSSPTGASTQSRMLIRSTRAAAARRWLFSPTSGSFTRTTSSPKIAKCPINKTKL